MNTRASDAWRGTVWTTRTLIGAYIAIGTGLTLQPARFSNTPSYHNLLVSVPAPAWGCMYLIVAALMVAWRLSDSQWLGVAAHTAAVILTSVWLLAFIIRFATDDGTTIVNVVSWAVFLSLIGRSTHGIDHESRP